MYITTYVCIYSFIQTMLLVLQDSKDEYLKLLSLLDFQCDLYNSDALITSSSDNIGKLRERFSSYIAYERKLDSSRFLEYWVPAPLSNVQLEQYCAILLSNSIALRSFSKHDSVGVLRNILISARKVGFIELVALITRLHFNIVVWCLQDYATNLYPVLRTITFEICKGVATDMLRKLKLCLTYDPMNIFLSVRLWDCMFLFILTNLYLL